MGINKCAKCGGAKPLESFVKSKKTKKGYSNICKECKKLMSSKWYHDDPEKAAMMQKRWRRSQPGRGSIARSKETARANGKLYVRGVCLRAVASGLIAKLPCALCGSKRVEAHHPNYGEPLGIVWFCPRHHGLIHRAIREDFKGDYGKSIRDIENQRQ